MRSTNVRIAAGISIIGAVFAFITLGTILSKDEINIAAALYSLVIAMLFFALAGQFFENGVVKGQAVAIFIAILTFVAIIAAYVLQNSFEMGWVFAMAVCALIPAAIAATEGDWYRYEKI